MLLTELIQCPTPSNTLSSCFPDVKTIANHGLLLDPGFADPPCASIFLAWPSPRHVALSSMLKCNQGVQRDRV